MGSTAARYDIVLTEGTAYHTELYLYDTDGSALDLSGWSAWEIAIVPEYGGSPYLTSASAEITVSGSAAGLLTIDITEALVNAEAGVWTRAKYTLNANNGTRTVPVLRGSADYERSSIA